MVELVKRSNPIVVDGYAMAGEVTEPTRYLLGFEIHYLLAQII